MQRMDTNDSHRFVKRPRLAVVGAVLAVAAMGVWFGSRGPSAGELVDQAVAGDLLTTDERLQRHHTALLREAARRLDELGPRDASARVGLAQLVAAVRYWQVADEIGSTVYMDVEQALVTADDEVVALLKRIWLAENPHDHEALITLSIRGLSGLDFNTDLAFVRAAWDDSGPQAKRELAKRIEALWQTANDRRQLPARPPDEFYASEPWEGYDPQTRRRMQARMRARLDEWAIPTLRAAARGEGVPAADAGAFRRLLRGLDIEADER